MAEVITMETHMIETYYLLKVHFQIKSKSERDYSWEVHIQVIDQEMLPQTEF